MMKLTFISIIYLGIFFPKSTCVDQSNFKMCNQSSFCKRHRQVVPTRDQSQYYVQPDSLTAISGSSGLKATVTDGASGRSLNLCISSVSGGAFRIHLNEVQSGSRGRFEIPIGDALLPNLAEIPTRMSWVNGSIGDGRIKLEAEDSSAAVMLQLRPFRVDLVLQDGRTAVSVNSRGLMHWEFLGQSPVAPETFRDHVDSMPHGPSSVGIDINFPYASRVYGIPEHADRLSLRSTVDNGDPYRLYNLDVFEYELDSRMALYGSIPVMYAHGANATLGAFWHNAAETWIDISYDKLVSGVDTHWISESGVIDLFLLPGRTPLSTIEQFAALVGTTPLPPVFALGYHQSRWNYKDEADVIEVNRRFNESDFPCDVFWLDIEHTDGKRCFTWDPVKFSNPQRLIDHLEASGRKLVTIVDPHVKRDDAWRLYSEVRDRKSAVRRPGGEVFDGWCWPGSSVWPDFLNPDVRSWWSQQFLAYPAAYTWNDMNEPSVFNGPEVTMAKDLLHSGGWEHRDVHNLYGALHHKASWAGQLLRSPGRRPFVLTRAVFAGSQRTAATWTGDNAAKWSHLKIAEPMLMSLGLGGISLVGADVGGFFGDPEPELLVRWYQAGAMQPFFRAHAHHDSKRREPYLFDKPYFEAMRSAVLLRYSLLPYIYTQFYFAQTDGRPVMAPLWVHHPNDTDTFDLDDQHLLGSNLLFKPVTEPGAKHLSVYLPKWSSWYQYESWQMSQGGRLVTVPVSLAASPLFVRAGSVVPRRETRPGRGSVESTLSDPLSLLVAIDRQSDAASGSLYMDDGSSRNSTQGSVLLELEFAAGVLVSRARPRNRLPPGGVVSFIESVAFLGLPARPSGVLGPGAVAVPAANFRYDTRNALLVVRRLRLPLDADWSLRLLPATLDSPEREEL